MNVLLAWGKASPGGEITGLSSVFEVFHLITVEIEVVAFGFAELLVEEVCYGRKFFDETTVHTIEAGEGSDVRLCFQRGYVTDCVIRFLGDG